MKGTESFKQTIHSYLEQRASEDTLFAEKYHAVNRSIDDIVTYILNQVMKSECHGSTHWLSTQPRKRTWKWASRWSVT